MKSIEQQIARIISRAAHIPVSDVRPDAKLSELGVNSLDQVECVMAVEETFQIEVDPQALWRLRTVQDVINAVEAAVAARA
ncbi:MAG: acyl carrier protein [Verrucomicrobia bacterium]|nr:acyl carrier protein [Verrucomicrobiota bacterium]